MHGSLKILSIAVIAILVASIALPLVPIPIASAASISSSRDEFGKKVWMNTYFYVDIATVSKAETHPNVTVRIYVAGAEIPSYEDNATYIEGTYYIYRAWFYIDESGALFYVKPKSDGSYDPSVTHYIATLSEGDTIKIEGEGVSVTLTFEHTAATLSIRSEVPYPLNMTKTADWRVSAPDLNKDPLAIDKFNATIVIKDITRGLQFPASGVTFKVEFEETDDNSGTFKPIAVYNCTADTKVGDGTEIYANLAVGYDVIPGDLVEITLSVPTYQGSSEVDEATVTIENIISTIAQVSIETANIRDFTVTIEDPDENKDTTSKDTIPVYIYNATGHLIWSGVATETDEDTGVFSVTIHPYSYITSGGINSTSNELTVYVTTGFYNASGDTYSKANVSATAAVAYTTASISAEPTEVLIPPTGTPVATITVTLNDSDLNLNPDARDTWMATISLGELVKEKKLEQSGYPTLALLSIKAVKGSDEVYLNASRSINIVFYETGDDTGVFKAVIYLRDFNWTWIREQLGGVPDKIVIIYHDMFNADLEKFVNVTAEVAVAKAKIVVDRSEVPLSHYDMKLNIKVEDPAAKGRGSVEVTISIYAYNGTKISSDTRTLEESGIMTGVFEGSYTISSSVMKPYLLGGYVEIVYGEVSEKIPFAVYSASIKVNGTSSITAKYGDVLNITVVDPDRNVDASTPDSFDITVGGVTVTLKETGDNTGVFTALVKLTGDVAEPATKVTVTYEDYTPTYITPSMTDWPSTPDTSSITIYVKSFTGELLVNNKSETVKIGPVGTLVIEVKDWDQNKDPESADKVSVYLRKWDGSIETIELDETGDSTGVFKAEYDLTNLGTPDTIIGKTIQIIYRDETDATGGISTLIVPVTIISWDAKISTDKNAYNVGEKIKVSVTDPDANTDPSTVDYIQVRVRSTSDPIGATVTLKETGPDTGVFEGEVLISNTIQTGAVFAKIGDTVTIEYTDPYPADYGTTGKSKTFTYEVAIGVRPTMPMKIEAASTVEPTTGATIEVAKVGKLVGISIEIKNSDIEDHTVTVIMVIRDAKGVAVQLQYQTIYVAAGKTATAGFTWRPAAAGSYTVEIYVVKSLADRTPLAPQVPFTYTVTVTE